MINAWTGVEQSVIGIDQWRRRLRAAFELQEDILTIHCDKLVKTLLTVIN